MSKPFSLRVALLSMVFPMMVLSGQPAAAAGANAATESLPARSAAEADKRADEASSRPATAPPKRLSPLAGNDAAAWASVPRWSHPRPASRPKVRRSSL